MENSISAQLQNVQVKFLPPLHEQRRAWVLDALRRESVTSALDVGCGEGILLQHLTHTAPWRAYSSSTPAPAVFEKPDLIHLRDLHGLDITRDDLLYAIDITEPRKHAYDWRRFEDLDVSIWEGGLQQPNTAFKGIDCIVATEVIEHLPEEVLTSFAPILLGNYAPRLLLFTTPSYDFNACFSAPGDHKWGTPDPTMRTDRVFRHLDHKFEWTVDECVSWCRAAAADWGYDVIIDGIGRSTTKDPWGRGGDKIRASQAVTFRRREGTEWDTRRATRYAEWASGRVERGQPHKLLATHHYEAHAAAEKPASREDIVAAIKVAIQTIGAADVTVFELWREEAISSACGGWLEVLIDVMDQDTSFVLHREGKDAEYWVVELPGVELRGRGPWRDAWEDTSDDVEAYEDEEYSEEYYDDDDDDEEDEEDEDSTADVDASGWSMTEGEGWGTEKDDTDSILKGWAEWKPTSEWIEESSWE
jgi:SAM-dependent methyltransferase